MFDHIFQILKMQNYKLLIFSVFSSGDITTLVVYKSSVKNTKNNSIVFVTIYNNFISIFADQ